MDILLKKIKLLREVRKHDFSFALCQQLLAVEPENEAGLSEAILNLIHLCKYSEAEQYARNLISVNPSNSWAFYASAYVLEKQGKLDESFDHIEKSIALNPMRPIAFEFIADLWCQKNDFQKALEFAENGLSINPVDMPCLCMRIRCLTELNRLPELPEAIEKGLYYGADSHVMHTVAGNAYLKMGMPDKAVFHFENALNLKPGYHTAQKALQNFLAA